MRICLQFEHIGFEQHLIEQFCHTDALLGTDVLALVLTAPFFHQVVEVGKFFLNLVRVSAWLINLVDCENVRLEAVQELILDEMGNQKKHQNHGK